MTQVGMEAFVDETEHSILELQSFIQVNSALQEMVIQTEKTVLVDALSKLSMTHAVYIIS